MFIGYGINITIQCNIKIVNYLDITLNLNNSTYKPYSKPANQIFYIHKESNHPPSIIRQITILLGLILSRLSSIKHVFNKVVTGYEEALNKAGFSYKLRYNNSSFNKITKNIIASKTLYGSTHHLVKIWLY